MMRTGQLARRARRMMWRRFRKPAISTMLISLALVGCANSATKRSTSHRERSAGSLAPLGMATFGSPAMTPSILHRAGATKWLGGSQLDSPVQMSFRQEFLPTLNVGATLKSQGGCAGDCTHGGTLNLPWIESTARRAVESTGSPGGYYVVGNEVDDSFSDNVAPTQAGYGTQLDAWVRALRKYDPRAHIVGPNFTQWEGAQCGGASTICYPWGQPPQWWSQFLRAYRESHGGAKPPFSYMSIHAYPPCNTHTPADTTAVDDYSRQVASDGYPGAVWVTEAALCFYQSASTPLTSTQQKDVTSFVSAYRKDPSVGRLYYFTHTYPGYDDGTSLSLRAVYRTDGSGTELASAITAGS
jgi:Glycosyl hydrolase catalytic core